ncbi:MAG: AraC family transcriptional regulator [Planctomycetota bacterium]|jgi:AraC-like DNA-binding protein
MRKNYDFHPLFVDRIFYVVHKGKKRNFAAHRHKHGPKVNEVIFVDYGNVELEVEDLNLTLSAGECVFIPGAKPHSFRGIDGEPFDYLNIMFNGKIPPILYNKAIAIKRNSFILFDRMKQEADTELPYFCESMACCLTEIIINLIRQEKNVVCTSDIPVGREQKYYSEVVNRALDIIDHQYTTNLSMNDLSEAIKISSSHLFTLLKRETGDNFSTLLHKRRVEVAKHLIKDSTHSINEISGLVGYSSTSFFFKIFKRLTGMTPKGYDMSLGDPAERG